MRGRTKLLIFGGVAVVGLIVLVSVLFSRGSVSGYIRDSYRQVSSQDAGRSQVFASAAAVGATADRIAGRYRPDDRVSSPQGQFLRYDDVIVGVTPTSGGSQIYLDDEDRGYRRWAAFVGPSWRPSVGRGEGFRGGGPGGGK